LVFLVMEAQDPAAEHRPMQVKHIVPTAMPKRMMIPVPPWRSFVAVV